MYPRGGGGLPAPQTKSVQQLNPTPQIFQLNPRLPQYNEKNNLSTDVNKGVFVLDHLLKGDGTGSVIIDPDVSDVGFGTIKVVNAYTFVKYHQAK